MLKIRTKSQKQGKLLKAGQKQCKNQAKQGKTGHPAYAGQVVAHLINGKQI